MPDRPPSSMDFPKQLNDVLRRLRELERVLNIPSDQLEPLETFSQGEPLGDTLRLNFIGSLRAALVGPYSVEVQGVTGEGGWDAIVDSELGASDPENRLFLGIGEAGAWLVANGYPDRANIFVRRRATTGAPDAYIETADVTFPDKTFIWGQPAHWDLGLTGADADITWDHANFIMTAQSFDVYGLVIDGGSSKTTLFNSTTCKATDCSFNVSAAGPLRLCTGSYGIMYRCEATQGWVRFSEAYDCTFRIYTAGSYDPSLGSGFVLEDCRLDCATLLAAAVTWLLPSGTKFRPLDNGAGGTLQLRANATGGDFDIECHTSQNNIYHFNAALTPRTLTLIGTFNNVVIPAPSSSARANIVDVVCTTLDVTGPTLIRAHVQGDTDIPIRGARVLGEITAVGAGSSGGHLQFIGATRCNLMFSGDPTGAVGTFAPYSFDGASSRNTLVIATPTGDYPAAGTGAGGTNNNYVLPVDIGAGVGAPVNADYLVGTANATLTGEIVVGATPGGELGGTWASPTVDTTHSGSAHGVAVQDETVAQGQALTMNFAGAGVTAAVAGSTATVTIPGGGSFLSIAKWGVFS